MAGTNVGPCTHGDVTTTKGGGLFSPVRTTVAPPPCSICEFYNPPWTPLVDITFRPPIRAELGSFLEIRLPRCSCPDPWWGTEPPPCGVHNSRAAAQAIRRGTFDRQTIPGPREAMATTSSARAPSS